MERHEKCTIYTETWDRMKRTRPLYARHFIRWSRWFLPPWNVVDYRRVLDHCEILCEKRAWKERRGVRSWTKERDEDNNERFDRSYRLQKRDSRDIIHTYIGTYLKRFVIREIRRLVKLNSTSGIGMMLASTRLLSLVPKGKKKKKKKEKERKEERNYRY